MIDKTHVIIKHHAPKTTCHVKNVELYNFELMSKDVDGLTYNLAEILQIIEPGNATQVYVINWKANVEWLDNWYTETEKANNERRQLIPVNNFETVLSHCRRDTINTNLFSCFILVVNMTFDDCVFDTHSTIYRLQFTADYKHNNNSPSLRDIPYPTEGECHE